MLAVFCQHFFDNTASGGLRDFVVAGFFDRLLLRSQHWHGRILVSGGDVAPIHREHAELFRFRSDVSGRSVASSVGQRPQVAAVSIHGLFSGGDIAGESERRAIDLRIARRSGLGVGLYPSCTLALSAGTSAI